MAERTRPEFDEIVTRLEDIIVEVQAGTFDDSDTDSSEGERTGRVTPPLRIAKKAHKGSVTPIRTRGEPKELSDVVTTARAKKAPKQ